MALSAVAKEDQHTIITEALHKAHTMVLTSKDQMYISYSFSNAEAVTIKQPLRVLWDYIPFK